MELNHYINYLKLEKRLSPATVLAYQKDLMDFQAFLFEKYQVQLAFFSKEMIRSYIVLLSQGGLKAKSINRKISVIKGWVKFLLSQNVISTSPVVGVSHLKTEKRIQIPLSQQETLMLEEITYKENSPSEESGKDEFEKARDRLILEVFYQSGIRRQELIDLQIKDVDFSQSLLKVKGKGGKQRLIPISSDLLLELKYYCQQFRGDLSLDAPFFCLKNGKIMYPKFVYNLVISYLTKVSVKQKRSPHVLRHSFATHLLNNGADIGSIKELMGHSSLAATQIYTHSDIEELKKVFNQSHPREKKN